MGRGEMERERETVSDWFGQIDYSAHWVNLVNTLNRVPFNVVDVVAAKIPCHVSRGRLGHSHLNDDLVCALLFYFHIIYWRAFAPKVKKKKLRRGIDLTLAHKIHYRIKYFYHNETLSLSGYKIVAATAVTAFTIVAVVVSMINSTHRNKKYLLNGWFYKWHIICVAVYVWRTPTADIRSALAYGMPQRLYLTLSCPVEVWRRKKSKRSNVLIVFTLHFSYVLRRPPNTKNHIRIGSRRDATQWSAFASASK